MPPVAGIVKVADGYGRNFLIPRGLAVMADERNVARVQHIQNLAAAQAARQLKAAQELGAKAKAYQVPSNKSAKAPPQAPDLKTIKLIDYDFAKYGSSAERTRLLAKWDKEVKNLPK